MEKAGGLLWRARRRQLVRSRNGNAREARENASDTGRRGPRNPCGALRCAGSAERADRTSAEALSLDGKFPGGEQSGVDRQGLIGKRQKGITGRPGARAENQHGRAQRESAACRLFFRLRFLLLNGRAQARTNGTGAKKPGSANGDARPGRRSYPLRALRNPSAERSMTASSTAKDRRK